MLAAVGSQFLPAQFGAALHFEVGISASHDAVLIGDSDQVLGHCPLL